MFVLHLALFVVAALANSMATIVNESYVNRDDKCGLWLAPSTISGAGIGLFAGRSYAAGEQIMVDLGIAIVDIDQHNTNQFFLGKFVWNDYIWSGDFFRMNHEGHHRVLVASEGSMNCFMGLDNVRVWYPRLWDGSDQGTVPATETNVGSGAQTQFHHRQVTALDDITAGDELFVNYGSHYFEIRRHLSHVPFMGDLERATRLLRKFTALQATLPRDMVWDVWDTFVTDTAFPSRALRGAWRQGDAATVREDVSHIQTNHGGNVTLARRATSRRTVDSGDSDSVDVGICADHIVGRPSTIPYAGMGAFATRQLLKDSVVAHLPMIPIADRGRLELFPLQHDGTRWVPVNDTVMGHQLLLNYCYGHAESTLLLCPYSPHVNYINHNQSRANVRIAWSHRDRVWWGNHQPQWLEATIETIAYAASNVKLAMDLIAIRDIAAGDEVLLDYGDEWEAAWREHVRHWRTTTRVSAAQLQSDRTSRLRTVFEELDEPRYSDRIQIMCDCACLWNPHEVQAHYRAGTLDTFLWDNQAEWWPCSILRSRLDEHNGAYLYTVHLLETDTADHLTSRLGSILNVPREIIYFVDKPYTSDMYLPNAFRHDMRIPDTLFPPSWRNRS